jgi:enterochelin esterase-like enzyme
MLGLAPILTFLALVQAPLPERPFHDLTHQSAVFGESRNFRVILPADYERSGKSYPVLYFFHGHSDRYTLESYDDGKEFVPKMVEYVKARGLIVVLVDGYVAEHYTGFYGGSPWDIREEGGKHDFGPYLKELVRYVDGRFRTLTDRRHRAVSGLSMGGFMALWISARYPDLIGSASAFNPGPEFFLGEPGRRSLWRPKDHVPNHSQTMIRLIRASGDYISQYHEETRAAYANADQVDFEYRVDEYHKHWITSVAETFDFHMRAFANPVLNNIPVTWSYASPYLSFSAWGYDVSVQSRDEGFIYLEDVRQGGFRMTSRLWAPDGPPMPRSRVTIRTAPVYQPGGRYRMLDHHLATSQTVAGEVTAGADGRITVVVDGSGHQLSFAGPGTGALPPVLLPLTTKDRLRLAPGVDLSLPVRIYNPRGEPMTEVTAELTSDYPTVQGLPAKTTIASIEPGAFADLAKELRIRLVSGSGYFAPARLQLRLVYDGWYSVTTPLDVLAIPEQIPAAQQVEVLDGRTITFPVFRQKGNQGGGGPVDVTVTEGKGNGNGVLEPGEDATIWVRMEQGMDPFDKNTWHRCRVHSDLAWLVEIGDIRNPKQREWTSAMERASLVRLLPETPRGTTIPLLLENESWSFHYTPDVRYGAEKLYQAFQLHTRHLHRFEIAVF